MLKICGKKISWKNGITKIYWVSPDTQNPNRYSLFHSIILKFQILLKTQHCVFFCFEQYISKKTKKTSLKINTLCIFATDWLLIKTHQKMKRDIFQAIADPTRRAILVLVATNALTPNAIAEQFNTTRQAVSKHIKILNECDLLAEKKIGREIYYQLKIDKMKEVDKWLEQFKAIWENRFSQLDQVLMNLKSKENEI